MVQNENTRTELLIGNEGLQKLRNACVLVVGVGGVGSFAAEALARTGIGHLILIDNDAVSLSNLNRQIMAVYDTVNIDKTKAMQDRIASYSKCRVDAVNRFFNAEDMSEIQRADFVIDAIDTITSKLDLIEACHLNNTPSIHSLGMGNRLDPSSVKTALLDKTSGDPLARCMRSAARKRKIDYPIHVLFSDETPHVQNQIVDPEGATRKEQIPPASCIFVPAAAGLLAASVCVRYILKGTFE